MEGCSVGFVNKLFLIFGTDRSERARYAKHVESLAAAVNTVYYNARTQVGIYMFPQLLNGLWQPSDNHG